MPDWWRRGTVNCQPPPLPQARTSRRLLRQPAGSNLLIAGNTAIRHNHGFATGEIKSTSIVNGQRQPLFKAPPAISSSSSSTGPAMGTTHFLLETRPSR